MVFSCSLEIFFSELPDTSPVKQYSSYLVAEFQLMDVELCLVIRVIRLDGVADTSSMLTKLSLILTLVPLQLGDHLLMYVPWNTRSHRMQ